MDKASERFMLKMQELSPVIDAISELGFGFYTIKFANSFGGYFCIDFHCGGSEYKRYKIERTDPRDPFVVLSKWEPDKDNSKFVSVASEDLPRNNEWDGDVSRVCKILLKKNLKNHTLDTHS